jgi:hypothetical protein
MSKPNVRNFTSIVPAAKSQAAIEQLLVQAGATTVTKFFSEETRQCEGFLFQLAAGPVPLVFRLPVNAELVYQGFVRRAGHLDSKKRTALRAQAERTAWKTMQEWVQIQLDMILTQQVEPLQAFLSYNYSQANGATFYDQIKGGSVKLLH